MWRGRDEDQWERKVARAAARERMAGERHRDLDSLLNVGVVGAGLMGTEIALVFALGGFAVILNDKDESALARAGARLSALLDRGVARGTYSKEQRDCALHNIAFAPELASLDGCGLVTEAVFETLETKLSVLKALDEACSSECILASNTSTLPISTLATALPAARRRRFLGTHYFSPVSRMRLVEVIPSFDTDPDTSTEVLQLLCDIDKTPILIRDVAGFAVNRMLHALLIEAVRLVDEGVATPEDLDTACRLGLGHPIGPFALMDKVTSSLSLQVQEILHEAYGERFRPPALLKQRVAAGLRGGDQPGWLDTGPAGAAGDQK